MKTETVTILFTDLVESTAILSRLGESRAETVRRSHFRLLRSVIGDYRGREVKNLGDGLMVAFESTVDAVMCAVTMQRRLHLQNDEGGETLEMRVAISTGEADIEDDDYFGLPVVEASRLCAVCPPGQILLSDFTRTLVGSRTSLTFQPLGGMVLKGFDAATVAHQIDWRGSAYGPRLQLTIRGSKTVVELHTQSLRIGRASDNDIAIDDDGVSRVHARIEHERGLWRLVDLGSTNGTRVNGGALPCWHARVLHNGDSIEIGDAELDFVDDAAPMPRRDRSTIRRAASAGDAAE